MYFPLHFTTIHFVVFQVIVKFDGDGVALTVVALQAHGEVGLAVLASASLGSAASFLASFSCTV